MHAENIFADRIANYYNKRFVYLVNSGTTALFVILQALRKFEKGNEVILPAYTAPSLVLPIQKADLKPVLCDISLETFNMDLGRLHEVLSPDTLCVLPVHMFGLPLDMFALKKIVNRYSTYVVEDAASSMGSELEGIQTGTFGNAGFMSFNRGKNLTTFCGGCIITNDEVLAGAIEDELKIMPKHSIIGQSLLYMKLAALYLAFKPALYSCLKSLICKFKYQHLHHEFTSYHYYGFQAELGKRLLAKADNIFKSRRLNSEYLFQALKDEEKLKLPSLPNNADPVFNQYPILIKNPKMRDAVHANLNAAGIESTILYPHPVHLAYDIGYELSENLFPNASYLAKRIILIPVHPLVNRTALAKTVLIIKNSMQNISSA
jgi:dTDP-4-amino-4,6-dideoxygalactose transaminase